MKNTLKLAGALLLAFAVSNVVKAIPIVGEIDVDAYGSQAIINFTANTVTFSPASANAKVSFTAGSYTLPNRLGDTATYLGFSYDGTGLPQTVWTIDSTTSFVLSSIASVVESTSGLTLTGAGTAYLTGYDATVGIWSFGANKTGTRFAFSSTAIVPDGGTTALLLGLGLLGMGLIRRSKKS